MENEIKNEESPLTQAGCSTCVELKELLQRTQAQFENFRKQQERRMSEYRTVALRDVLLDLLDVMDNFERALLGAPTTTDPFIQGIELIYAQCVALLEKQDITPIPSDETIFNAQIHEALLKVPSDKPEQTVLEVLQKGYYIQDKILRPAKVKLSAGNKEETNHDK